ncbi:hypothetical protein S40285_02466 [Stachybotrys chlorohalonatus IBT 40285]|uniref:Cytochrome P450 n=1 Tax=Stachybotrys chlorohalonatus (strain IBT 40285) TaxID=1283841 RepID=A0A084R0U4_STAC4|nr:hypothetical protein S40285_02466 [Stachybotrys chlorohalonata IBT 40285]
MTKETTIVWTWSHAAYLVCGTWLLWCVGLMVQRLCFSPLAHIPGPKLAATTQFYEFYYDIILGGQYTFKIVKLHEKYGPVVRINPWEVHVKVHDFHTELYGNPTRPRARWSFWTRQFGAPDSALATIDHSHHRLRKNALNPFFSSQKVRSLQPVIEERVDALLRAILKYANTTRGLPLNVMYPFSAFTNDVINEYAFARSDHLIEESDFGAQVTENLLMGTHMGPLIKHADWALRIVNFLPESISGRWVPGWDEFLKLKKDIRTQIQGIKASEHTEKWQLDVNHPTIFHELLSSRLLPPEEKTPERLGQEGQILVQGGTLTTSWTLSLATFHLLNKPSTLRKLRDELFAAFPAPEDAMPLAKLEGLPYLRAVIKESLRLGIGTSGRLARIAPDEALVCRDPKTGKVYTFQPGTVVSMSPYMTVMDATIFADPLGFHPERWLEDGDSLDQYLVIWGGGTRICLGKVLAYAELYLMLAKLFRQWGGVGGATGDEEGDRRPGDIGYLKVFETTTRDCEMASDYFIPMPHKGSNGLRFLLEAC